MWKTMVNENLNLTYIDEIDSGECYEFNKITVWKDKEGNFYYAKDNGCSCPEPYEWVENLSDLNRLTIVNFSDFEAMVNSHDVTKEEKMKFIDSIRKHMGD